MTPKNKIYLGDGAYAEFNGDSILITAENGIGVTDAVLLEEICLIKLFAFAKEKGVLE